MHVVVHRSSNSSSNHKVVSVICKGSLELEENPRLSDALALEQMKQEEMSELDLNDTSVYVQRFSTNGIDPNFIVQFVEHDTSYMLLENNGVSQWYFQDGGFFDSFAGLPKNSGICRHEFFSMDLVPVTCKMLRDIDTLYDAANPGRKCKAKPTHKHHRFHIYLTFDLSMIGPLGGSTKYMVVTACEDTKVADLFCGVSGGAATKDEHLLRNFSWGSIIPGQTQSTLMTGMPYCYGTVKDTPLALNEIGWRHDDGVVWLYPCKMLKGRNSSV